MPLVKKLGFLLPAVSLLATTAFATVSMTVTVNPSISDGAMPANYTGASSKPGPCATATKA